MKLFIDTSNKKLLFALIDNYNKVISFYNKESNNDIVRTTLPELKKFLNKNNVKVSEIEEYLFTIGPGSFTGVKVALNIVKSFSMVNDISRYWIIDSFKLIEQEGYDSTIIPFGKSKFYHKKKIGSKVRVITMEDLNQLENFNDGYSNITKDLLQQKIDSKSFKIIDNLDKVKIKYLSAF